MKVRIASIFMVFVVLFSCKGNKNTASSSLATAKEKKISTYTNPVFAENFADPTVIKVGNWYFAYATQSRIDGKTQNIQCIKSKDLVNWQRVGDALPQKPDWAENHFWAPHVIQDRENKKFYMYFSGESKDENIGKCLGVAVADSPEGPFIDKGEPLKCGKSYINIDPIAFDHEGKKYLYWGSGHKPIKVKELTADRLNFKDDSKSVDVIFPIPDKEYAKLAEGAWIIEKDAYFYMFYSGENCCGENAHYAVMVARAQSPLGPFTTLGDANGTGNSVILELNKTWKAPGHNSIIKDEAGEHWMLYHAIYDGQDSTKMANIKGRVMLIDKLQWKDGWPYIAGNAPSTTPQQSPILK